MKTLLFFISFFANSFFYSQELAFDWVNIYESDASSTISIANSVITDSAGNSYTTGYFFGTIDFDLGSSVTNLTSNGDKDIFLAKADIDGNFLWAQSYGSNSVDYGIDLAFDESGNIIFLGRFDDTVDFDYGPGILNLTSFFGGVVLKLDTDGNLIWGKSTNFISPKKIISDELGNLYLTGQYSNTCDLDLGPGIFNLSAHDGEDIFVAKYDTQGNLVWAKSIGGDFDDEVFDIAIDGSKNVMIVGIFEDDIDFDPGPGFQIHNVASGSSDGFVVKLSPTGDFVWSEQLATTGGTFTSDEVYALAVDSIGNLYLGGRLHGTMDFNPGSAVYNLTATYGGFIQKLSPNGSFIWTKIFDGTSAVSLTKLIVKGNDLYFSGAFEGTLDMDPGPNINNLISYVTVGTSNSDKYASKLDLNGNYKWAYGFGHIGSETFREFHIDSHDAVILAGSFSDSMDFDPGPNLVGYHSGNNGDIFVLRLNQCSSNTGTDVIQGCQFYTWINGVTYTSNNNSATYMLTNVAGCDSLVTLDLTVLPLNSGVTFVNGVYTSSAVGSNYNYQWLDCNNGYSIISGETNSSFTPSQNGNYALEITNGNCVDTSVCISINNVEINEIEKLSLVQIFPNPSTGAVTLDLGFIQEASLSVYSVGGSLVYNSKIKDNKQHTFELNVESGIYLIDVMTKEGKAHFKLVVK